MQTGRSRYNSRAFRPNPSKAPVARLLPMNVLFEDDGHLKAGSVLADNDASLQVEAVSGKRLKIKSGAVLLRFASPTAGALLPRRPGPRGGTRPRVPVGGQRRRRIRIRGAGARVLRRASDARAGNGGGHAAARAADVFLQEGQGPLPQGAAGFAARRAGVGRTQAARGGTGRRLGGRARCAPAAGGIPRRSSTCCCTSRTRWRWNGRRWRRPAMRQGPIRSTCWPPAARFRRPTTTTSIAFCPKPFPRARRSRTGARCRRRPRFRAPTCARFPSTTRRPPKSTTRSRCANSRTATSRSASTSPARRSAMPRGSALDAIARERLSTVYMPGRKLTMLPEPAVAAFTLKEGTAAPALSLYVETDPAGAPVAHATRLNLVPIAANLNLATLSDAFANRAAGARRSAMDTRDARVVEAGAIPVGAPRQDRLQSHRLQLRRGLERRTRRPRDDRATRARQSAGQAGLGTDDPRQQHVGTECSRPAAPRGSTACRPAAR